MVPSLLPLCSSLTFSLTAFYYRFQYITVLFVKIRLNKLKQIRPIHPFTTPTPFSSGPSTLMYFRRITTVGLTIFDYGPLIL